MITLWKAWFLTRRTYIIGFALALPAVLSVWFDPLYYFVLACLIALCLALVTDTIWLWAGNRRLQAHRKMAERLSNGEQNPIELTLQSSYPVRVRATVIDEIPIQLQERKFALKVNVDAHGSHHTTYMIRPVERGIYTFGAVNVYVKGRLGFVERKFTWEANKSVAVYPSVMEMRRAEMYAFSHKLSRPGMRKQRRIGHTMEFEKIKEYVAGDDVRTINWKATARTGSMRVNLYQDERSQDVVSVIDAGRVMRAPFNGMTSLDYAVNAALAFSNVVIKKHDHPGLVVYGSKWSTCVKPSGSTLQLGMINEALYGLSTEFDESNDEQLVLQIRSALRRRSLVMLYTNIDTLGTLRRRLPSLLHIAKRHLLVVVLFDNTEVRSVAQSTSIATLEDVYTQMVARDAVQQKRDIAIELKHHGIHCVVSPPEKLSIASINQYLDLKSRGVI